MKSFADNEKISTFATQMKKENEYGQTFYIRYDIKRRRTSAGMSAQHGGEDSSGTPA